MHLPHRFLLGLALGLMACSPSPPPDETCAEDFEAREEDFTCSQEWEQVGHVRIRNRCGRQTEAVELLRNPRAGAQYPVGTMVTLMTGEVMVKRGPSFDPANNNWEYFTLDLHPLGARVSARGKAEVKNGVGSCLACHAGAKDFDFICRTDHGCEALDLTAEQLELTQVLDPRCAPP